MSIGRFIGDVVERMQMTVDGKDDVRFALYSGHDNTLSPFLSAFNMFDGRQPPMASGTPPLFSLYFDGVSDGLRG